MEESSREEAEVLDKGRLRTFLLGGAAGVLAGILLAPRSGRETRGSIADRAGEARERGRETFFETQERMRERLAEGREGRRSPGPSAPADAADLRAGAGPYGAEAAPEDVFVEDVAAEEAPRPRLRDVSRGAGGRPDERPGPEAERAEELRRKVRETRARLRGRLDEGAPPPEVPGDGGEEGR